MAGALSPAGMRPAGLALAALACGGGDGTPSPESERLPLEEHVTLGASFVSGDSAALRRLLHPDVIVQPPAPDSARQGAGAIAYLLELAVHSEVTESRLEPRSVIPEGPFALERGTWLLGSGDRLLQSPYMLRWRTGDDGWRVVLWRWGRFR
jgi:Domain of unknown function (DUF4440)